MTVVAAALIWTGMAPWCSSQLRQISGEVQLADVRAQVGLSYYHDFENFTTFAPLELRTQQLTALLDQLVSGASALKPLRTARTHPVAG